MDHTAPPPFDPQLDAAIRLDGRVAIVTGAGGGLGRAHALALAQRGAQVVVNDLGVSRDGLEAGAAIAEQVAETIRRAGGQAMASTASVCDPEGIEAMVRETMARWGRIDILVNNAGFLRDKSFSNMTMADFEAIIDVHLLGAARCSKAVWDIMKAQRHGRIVMTTSSSGLFGNFGQANYGAAKMGLVGLMQTLAIEGQKYGIRVNCLAPSAATRMTETLFAKDELALLTPERITPGLLYLVSDQAPSKMVLCAGAGVFSCAQVTLTRGLYMEDGPTMAEAILQQSRKIADRTRDIVPYSGFEQSKKELHTAAQARSGAVTRD